MGVLQKYRLIGIFFLAFFPEFYKKTKYLSTMRKFKTLLSKSVLFIAIISAAACSGDDSEETNNNNNNNDFSDDKIVGEWKLVGYEDLESGVITPINDNSTVYDFNADGGGTYYVGDSDFDLTWEPLGNSVYNVEYTGGGWTYEVEFQDSDNTMRIEDSDSAQYYERK